MTAASEAKTKAHRTRDHDTIRRWAETRGGHPALVEDTEILRFDFREPDEKLKQVSWEEFFEIFEDSELALLLSPEGKSRFNKFVSRR